eukprot:scaffold69502_cov67-Phaeocystis_antarctica.AAC.2
MAPARGRHARAAAYRGGRRRWGTRPAARRRVAAHPARWPGAPHSHAGTPLARNRRTAGSGAGQPPGWHLRRSSSPRPGARVCAAGRAVAHRARALRLTDVGVEEADGRAAWRRAQRAVDEEARKGRLANVAPAAQQQPRRARLGAALAALAAPHALHKLVSGLFPLVRHPAAKAHLGRRRQRAQRQVASHQVECARRAGLVRRRAAPHRTERVERTERTEGWRRRRAGGRGRDGAADSGGGGGGGGARRRLCHIARRHRAKRRAHQLR